MPKPLLLLACLAAGGLAVAYSPHGLAGERPRQVTVQQILKEMASEGRQKYERRSYHKRRVARDRTRARASK